MQFFVGTSGYSYKEWKGDFYPPKLPAKEMLAFYAQNLATVECNSTFQKMPEAEILAAWAGQTPTGFRFAIKAPQQITHRRRLTNAEAEVRELVERSAVFRRKRGPLFFQLPPNFKKDVPRLDAFLKLLKGKLAIAFEFRHPTWFDEEVAACLRAHGVARVLADAEELPKSTLVATTDWGYLRLRRENYTDAALRKWIGQIRSQPWKEAYVFFKHEETGTGPRLAKRFLKLAGAAG